MTPYLHTLVVRFADCDSYRHVNNAVFVTYMQEARGAFWRHLRGAAFSGYDFIIAEITCSYRSPAVEAETLAIAVAVEAVGTKSFTLGYTVTAQDGRLVATGRSVQVAYDHEAKRSHALAPEVRAALAARLTL